MELLGTVRGEAKTEDDTKNVSVKRRGTSVLNWTLGWIQLHQKLVPWPFQCLSQYVCLFV